MSTPERKEYPNPPIEEALCQVLFAEPLAWSIATPGQLFEALKTDYPAEPEEQDQIEAQLQDPPNLSLARRGVRYVYSDEAKSRKVVANATTISVNSLRPYDGWPSMRQRLGTALQQLERVTPLVPISRVSLRYINRIVLPGPHLNTDDYFKVPVRTADDGKAPFKAFMYRVESVLADGDVLAISTFATLQAIESGFPFLLDLDFQRLGLSLLSIEEALEVADELHSLENREFESVITDATRELFK